MDESARDRFLILIRHSISTIDPSIPSAQWTLSADGVVAVERLLPPLRSFQISTIFTSNEPKARQTGQILSRRLCLPSAVIENLHEHERSNFPVVSAVDFHKAVLQLFNFPDRVVMGTESARQAENRFQKAIELLLAEHPDETLAIVSHGTVMSLFAANYLQPSAQQIWRALQMPDLIIFKLPEMLPIVLPKSLSAT